MLIDLLESSKAIGLCPMGTVDGHILHQVPWCNTIRRPEVEFSNQ